MLRTRTDSLVILGISVMSQHFHGKTVWVNAASTPTAARTRTYTQGKVGSSGQVASTPRREGGIHHLIKPPSGLSTHSAGLHIFCRPQLHPAVSQGRRLSLAHSHLTVHVESVRFPATASVWSLRSRPSAPWRLAGSH